MAKKRTAKQNLSLTGIIIAILFFIVSVIMDQAGLWDDALDAVSNGTDSSATIDTKGTVLDAYFIDVGQGDCSLFVSKDESMLIDCGEKENAQTVIATLSETGITKLDYVVVTHAHSDHMGAMAEIIENIDVENILLSEPCNDSSETATYERFLDAAEESGAEIILAEKDYTFTLGYANCKILSPAEIDSNENNNSIVMHIAAGETSFLLTGDAEKKIEKEVMKNYPYLTATILKVGHHGSSTSSYEDFVKQISPEAAIIQCGADNSYGHPHKETVSVLNELGITFYRSDIYGNIKISCTADSYTLSTEK